MFIDRVEVHIKAGDGGDGMIAFHREKFIDKGGPSGGDGGRGGSVIFVADGGLTTLLDFQYQRFIEAPSGGKGMGKNMYGRSGEDKTYHVPVGTLVMNKATGRVIADFKTDGQTLIVAQGGRGGRGNAHFKSSAHQVPKIAENGAPGEEFDAILELKLLADVGLVGFPSVGKSSLLAAVTAAKPAIADYHFTTVRPQLGVAKSPDGRSFVMADLPGLIEGAHQGKGMGLQFLKHIERCRVLVHVIDMAAIEGRDPVDDYHKIMNELKQYGMRLLERPMILVANKMDNPEGELLLENFLERVQLPNDTPIYQISALAKTGLDALLYKVADLLETTPIFPLYQSEDELHVTYDIHPQEKAFIITRLDQNRWRVHGERVEYVYRMTNITTDEGLHYLLSLLRKMGVDDELKARGVQEGDSVIVVDYEFEYMD